VKGVGRLTHALSFGTTTHGERIRSTRGERSRSKIRRRLQGKKGLDTSDGASRPPELRYPSVGNTAKHPAVQEERSEGGKRARYTGGQDFWPKFGLLTRAALAP